MSLLISILLLLICYIACNKSISDSGRTGGMVVFSIILVLCLIM